MAITLISMVFMPLTILLLLVYKLIMSHGQLLIGLLEEEILIIQHHLAPIVLRPLPPYGI